MEGLLLTYGLVAFGTLASLRYPIIGLYIYVGFSVLRPEALWGWAGNLHGMSRLVGLSMLIGWAFQGFGSWKFGGAKSIVWCILLFIAWSMVSALQAIDPEISWNSIVEFSKTVLPFLVGVTMLKTEKEARALLWTMVLLQTYVCTEMNQSYLLEGYNRAHADGFGSMDNNSFGISLVTTLGAALGLMLSSKKWWTKGLAAASTVLILHTVLLTFSRGAFVGMLSTAVVAVVLFPKRPKYIGAVVLAGLLALRLTGPELAERLATTFAPREERDGSAESRFALWADCMTVVASKPILGVGPHNWPLVADDFGWGRGKEAHSVWIQTAAETGIPGVLFLLLFYGFTVKRLWRIARAKVPGIDESTAMFAAGIILAIVGFAVSAQFVSLVGLEPPYYVAMAGAVLLKTLAPASTVPVPVRQPEPSRRPALRPAPARTPLPRPS